MGTTTPASTRPAKVPAWVRWTVAASVIMLGLFAATGWWLWSSWKSQPDAFWDHREAFGYTGGEYELSQGPYRIQVAEPQVRSGTARIDEVEPVVVTNTADARITFSVCTLKPRGGEGFGGSMEDLTRFCSEVIPLEEGHVLPLGHHTGQQVTMNIDPAHAGTVKVAGVRVTYKHGMQYGTQVVSNSASVQFVDSSRSGD